MDAAGKDGIIEHVFSGVNPQGCEVHSFKGPSEEEIDHDFLWRTSRRLPPRGDIGIFNRSYYEEVLVVRVFPALLDRQRLPSSLVGKRIWRERFHDIVAHERYLGRNGVAIRKVFLNVSQGEQQQRLLKRIEDPLKQWKFAPADLDQRRHWPDFMRAYEDAIRHTSTPTAPWYVVPADRKWWARTIVSRIIADALAELNPRVPEVSARQRREMTAVKRSLQRSSI
jgi:PPK2 family polyphosphate:nucleotide phosphotransferase